MRLHTRDGGRERRIRLIAWRRDIRCIDIAAPSRRRIERDALKALACRRRRQTFGNLDIAREILLAVLVRRIPELLCHGIERLTDEILLGEGCCRLRIESCIVRSQRDLAAV